jgi:hypothetical protein
MVAERVQTFVDGLDLDELDAARASIALALAAKLDQAADSSSPGVAQSVASIARELRETLEVLADSKGEAAAFVAELFQVPA